MLFNVNVVKWIIKQIKMPFIVFKFSLSLQIDSCHTYE